MYIYIYMRALMFIQVYIYIYTCIDWDIFVYNYISMYVYTQLYVCIVCLYIYMCVCIYIYLYQDLNMHIYIYIYIYILIDRPQDRKGEDYQLSLLQDWVLLTDVYSFGDQFATFCNMHGLGIYSDARSTEMHSELRISIWLVVWIISNFSILGMSSSQLTFIFFRGVETTNQLEQLDHDPYSAVWFYVRRKLLGPCQPSVFLARLGKAAKQIR